MTLVNRLKCTVNQYPKTIYTYIHTHVTLVNRLKQYTKSKPKFNQYQSVHTHVTLVNRLKCTVNQYPETIYTYIHTHVTLVNRLKQYTKSKPKFNQYPKTGLIQ